MTPIDLLSKFRQQVNINASTNVLSKTQSNRPQYYKTQFDIQAMKLRIQIIQCVEKAKEVRSSWESQTVSFVLEDKFKYIHLLGQQLNKHRECMKTILDNIQQLKKEDYVQRKERAQYQDNVCKCLELQLIHIFDILTSLKKHANQTKQKANFILNIPKDSSQQTNNTSTQSQFVHRYDPEYKQQAMMLRESFQNDMQQMMNDLQTIQQDANLIKILTLSQQNIAIQFRNNVYQTFQNIKLGSQQLKAANKSEGQSGEYWMWFFITLTIMIVILDWVKK